MQILFTLIFTRAGSWGTRSSFPFAARPFAAGEPHVRRHSCFSPAVYGTCAGHPSAQHFSLHHPEQGRRGLSFTVEGAAAFQAFSTPHLSMSSLHDTLIPLSHFLNEWERLPGVSLWVLRTIRTGYTLQFGKNPPRFDGVHLTVVNSPSKALCSTTGTFLPPTERSNRGSTAVGSRTRVLQPATFLVPKRGRRLEAYFWIYGV